MTHGTSSASPIDMKAVITRLKNALNLREDTELAEIMDVTPKTIGAWKRRGTIPVQKIADICTNRNLNLHFILTGEQPPPTATAATSQQPPSYYSAFPELDSVVKEAGSLWNRLDQTRRFEMAAKMLKVLQHSKTGSK